jgi:hypothetical protein
MKEFKHIFDAIVEGQPIQFRRPLTASDIYNSHASNTETVIPWKVNSPQTVLANIAAGFQADCFRVVPKTININGHEVPEPVREPPKLGQKYYVASTSHFHVGQRNGGEWDDDSTDNEWLNMGLIHLTPEAAEAHATALLSFTKKV